MMIYCGIMHIHEVNRGGGVYSDVEKKGGVEKRTWIRNCSRFNPMNFEKILLLVNPLFIDWQKRAKATNGKKSIEKIHDLRKI